MTRGYLTTEETEHIQTALDHIQTALRNEDTPLAVFTTFPEAVDTPAEMAAALCYLLENNVTVAQILTSGLLQTYAIRHAFNMADIAQTYFYLSQVKLSSTDAQDARQDLLNQVALIQIPSQHEGDRTETLHRHAIDGTQLESREPITVPYQQPQYNWDINENKLRGLVDLLGESALTRALYEEATGQHRQLLSSLQRITEHCTGAEIAALYRYICTSIPEDNDMRQRVLSKLKEIQSIDAETLGLLLCECDVTECNMVLSTIPPDTLNFILQQGAYLGIALRPLNRDQIHALLSRQALDLSQIIRTHADVIGFLRAIEPKQAETVLTFLSPEIPRCIDDGLQLSEVLRQLGEVKRDYLLQTIELDLLAIIQNGDDLGHALSHLNTRQRDWILSKLEPYLHDMIQRRNDLETILEYLSPCQARKVLNPIKGRLPKLLKDGYAGPHHDLVHTAIQDIRQFGSMFSNPAVNIHVGTLTEKLTTFLEKYYTPPTQARMRDRLTTLFSGISHEDRMMSCFAAAHTLAVAMGECPPNFGLVSTESLPDEATLQTPAFKSSYLWVNHQQLYFIAFDGSAYPLDVTDPAAVSAIFENSDGNRLNVQGTQDTLGDLVTTPLPSTSIHHALQAGLLGDIISSAGGIDEIFQDVAPAERRARFS